MVRFEPFGCRIRVAHRGFDLRALSQVHPRVSTIPRSRSVEAEASIPIRPDARYREYSIVFFYGLRSNYRFPSLFPRSSVCLPNVLSMNKA
jgi:hypothetical protein